VERRRAGPPGPPRGRLSTADAPSPEWLAERLAGPARSLGVEVPERALARLARFVALALEWGARVNLTGARIPERLVDEHVADALACLPHLPGGPFRYVDVGSGAGLPGLVIALIRLDASGVLLEPIGKKRAFLAHAIRELGLAGRIEARAERLAEHLRSGGASAYDVAVSRAVWPASRWLDLGRPLLRPGGVLLGVEGSAASALPPGAERHPYRLTGRRRAVVVLHS
jgi:16S rRNA (guanine527-N7)-methyltransferase